MSQEYVPPPGATSRAGREVRYWLLLIPLAWCLVIQAFQRPDAIAAWPEIPFDVKWLIYDESDLAALAVRGANSDMGRLPGRIEAPDWDIPVSIIMALVAYVTAPWCMRVLIERRWRQWPAMLFLTWFGVDGCYAAYWSVVNPVALELMREANAPASLSLFWAVGLFWMYQGSLNELMQSAAAAGRRAFGR